MATKKKTHHRGGARSNSGRPAKVDKALWGKVTCVLRLDTIAKLKAGVGSKAANPQFGEYLQFALDQHRLPTREQYLAYKEGLPFVYLGSRHQRVQVINSKGPGPTLKRRLLTQAQADLRRTLAEVRKERAKRQ